MTINKLLRHKKTSRFFLEKKIHFVVGILARVDIANQSYAPNAPFITVDPFTTAIKHAKEWKLINFPC